MNQAAVRSGVGLLPREPVELADERLLQMRTKSEISPVGVYVFKKSILKVVAVDDAAGDATSVLHRVVFP